MTEALIKAPFVLHFSTHFRCPHRTTYDTATDKGVSLNALESALVRVTGGALVFLLNFILYNFVLAIIVNAYSQLAPRCRKKQSMIMVRKRGGYTIYQI